MHHFSAARSRVSYKSRLRQGRGVGVLLVLLLLAVALRALWHWREGDAWKNAAVPELEAAARRSPTDARILHWLGLRLEQQGRDREAFDALTRAASADADDEVSWLGAARLSRKLYGDQGALDLLAFFLKRHPHSKLAHIALAEVYLDFHTYPRVWEEAAVALREDPSSAEAFRLEGVAEAGMNHLSDAEKSLRRSIALAPADWRSQFALAGVLTVLSRNDEAEKVYRATVALAPMEPAPCLTLGQWLFQRAKTPAQYAEAQVLASRCIALAPATPGAHLLLGRIASRLSQWPQARTELLAAKQLEPHAPEVAYELARVYQHLGEAENAARELRRFQWLDAYLRQKKTLIERLTINDRDNKTRLALARLAAANGDDFEAERQYRLLLARQAFTEIVRKEISHLPTREAPPAPEGPGTERTRL